MRSLSLDPRFPTGRLTDRFTPDCQGQVSLDGGEGDLGEGLTNFPVRLDELQTPPLDQAQVLAWYEDRSGLKGRYRVLESFDGAGPGVGRGRSLTGRMVISPICVTRGTSTLPTCSRH